MEALKMINYLDALVDTFEQTEEDNKEFKIDNDSLAEWAIVKIKKERSDMERLIKVCNMRIAEYEEKISNFKKQCENSTSFLISHLKQYFDTVPHTATKKKTQETYKLPSGTLKLKFPNPEIVRDDDKLLQWLKDNGKKEFIKIEETPIWGELKKQVVIQDSVIVTADGEIVDGVQAIARSPEFVVD